MLKNAIIALSALATASLSGQTTVKAADLDCELSINGPNGSVYIGKTPERYRMKEPYETYDSYDGNYGERRNSYRRRPSYGHKPYKKSYQYRSYKDYRTPYARSRDYDDGDYGYDYTQGGYRRCKDIRDIPEVRYSSRCLPRGGIYNRLSYKGWHDFHEIYIREDIFKVSARRRDGTLYRLSIDRCTGNILSAWNNDKYKFRNQTNYRTKYRAPRIYHSSYLE